MFDMCAYILTLTHSICSLVSLNSKNFLWILLLLGSQLHQGLRAQNVTGFLLWCVNFCLWRVWIVSYLFSEGLRMCSSCRLVLWSWWYLIPLTVVCQEERLGLLLNGEWKFCVAACWIIAKIEHWQPLGSISDIVVHFFLYNILIVICVPSVTIAKDSNVTTEAAANQHHHNFIFKSSTTTATLSSARGRQPCSKLAWPDYCDLLYSVITEV